MKKGYFLILFLCLFTAFGFADNITPTRTDVSGFTSWTDNSVAGTTYLQLLVAGASTISPAMNFDSYTGETLNFNARTYGGTNTAENTITVSISTDNGSNWTSLGTRIPTSSTMGAMTSFDLSSYNGTQVKIKFSVAGTSNTIGVGIDDIAITGTLATSSASDIIEFPSYTYPTNIDYSLYQTTNISNSSSDLEVAKFTIRDGGATADGDALGTTLTAITFNVTNYANLRRLAIYDGTNEISEVGVSSGSVAFTGISLAAADGGTKVFTLRASFNSSVTDNQQFSFTVSSATASASGSTFAAANAGAAASSTSGDNNRIEVTAVDIVMEQNVSNVIQGAVMTPSPTVKALDNNLNLDLDYTAAFSVAVTTGSVTFSPSATTTGNFSAGVATLSNLVFNSSGTGNVLTVTSGSYTDISNSFNVTNPQPDINLKQSTTSIATGGSYGFSDVQSSASGSPVTFTIENLGTADLTISGTPGLSGTNPTEFTVNATSMSSTVAASATTTFTVTFTPTSIGAKSAVLTIASNDPDEASYTVNLSGTSYGSPSATTSAAGSVSYTTATLNGTVNANYASTTVTFEYGLTDTYGSTATAAQSPVTGSSNTSVSAALSSLTEGTTYHFRVKAVNTAGTTYGSDLTFATSVNVPTVTTTTPSGTSSSAATSGGNITSTGGASVTEHGICWNTAGTPTTADSKTTQGAASTGSFSSDMTGLLANTTYHVRAYATNSAGTAYGSDLSFTTSNLTAPTANAVSAVGSTGFTGSWNSIDGATGYKVDVYTQTSVTTTTDLIISEYVMGSSSNKYVEIYNGTGSSVDLSNYKLELYANGSATYTNTVTLSGTLANGSAIVYKNSSAALTLPNGVTATTSTVCNFNGDDAIALLKISPAGYVDIFGKVGEDPGTNWSSTSNTTLSKTLVRKATVTSGVTTNPTSGFPTLEAEWTQYNVDDATHLGSHTFTGSTTTNYSVQDASVAGLTYTASSLSPNTQYNYRVRATSSSSTSSNSNVITFTTAPAAPASAAAGSVTTSGFSASWNAATGATSYRLDVATDNLFTQMVTGYNDLTVSSTSQSVASLSPNSTYYFRVRAVSSNGTGDNSSTVTVVTLPNSPVSPVISNAGTGSLTISWTAPAGGASGYKVDVATDEAFNSLVANNVNSATTSLTVSSLTQNTLYYIRVRAYNSASSNGAYATAITGKTASAVRQSATITTSGSPQVVSYSGFSTGVNNITFNNVSQSGTVSVSFIRHSPADASTIANHISEYHWIIEPAGGFACESYTLRFDLSELPESDGGIRELADGDNTHLTLYKRSTIGSGAFSNVGALTYHRNGTISDQSDDYLTSEVITTGFSEFAFGSTSEALPVELTSFTATFANNRVVLKWATASEQNSERFVVQRRNPGAAKNEWVNITSVQGAGNSNSHREYSYADGNLTAAGKYQYRLVQFDNDGTSEILREVEVDVNNMPTEFTLSQNFPNPFNPGTVISYTLPQDSRVELNVYSITGQLVKTLVNQYQQAGYYNVPFDASKLTSGLYIYQIKANGTVKTRKMTLLK